MKNAPSDTKDALSAVLECLKEDDAELKAAIDDENLAITGDHVLVLRNAGPQGGPGMPEWGMLPMPKALLKKDPRHGPPVGCAHERHQLRRLRPACST
jgi:hypothetical protein